MNLRTIKLVIGREYSTRVKKKSFLILTFLVPIFFALMCTLPTIIMMHTKDKTKNIAVVDNSGIVLPYLTDNQTAKYNNYTGQEPEELKSKLGELGMDVLVLISPMDSSKNLSVQTYSDKPAGVDFVESLESKVNDAVEDYRIKSYNIEGLQDIMNDVKADVKVTEFTIGDDGKETVSESGIYMILSMILGMIIYMFIAMFGGMVMSSVIEEKSSRVVEVIISSVKSIDLMFGKILGIALVALTQFALWIVLTLVLVVGANAIFGLGDMSSMSPEQMSQMSEMATAGMGVDLDSITATAGENSQIAVILTTLRNIPWGKLILCFLLYFIFGYLLYASMYAAVGSAVENEGDSSQLQLPITIPLMIGFFVVFMAMNNPYSKLVWWCSMIPFTSPIVMLARIPYGVPNIEIIISLVLLALTFVLMAWVSAKIYKAGILMFGKKTSFKDLWKWLKQK